MSVYLLTGIIHGKLNRSFFYFTPETIVKRPFMLFWSAFIIGLVSNFHCLGMCGPIALAIPVKRTSQSSAFLSIALYNAGRISIYVFMGIVFGLFGQGFGLMGVQQFLSIALGLTFIGFTCFGFLKKRNWISTKLFSHIIQLKYMFRRQFSKETFRSILVIGLLNGLLPCGMVYMSVAGAVISGGWQSGALYMFLFGLGTLPVMILLPYFRRSIGDSMRQRFRKLIPITIFIFGMWLVFRGIRTEVRSTDSKGSETVEMTNCY